MARRSKRGNVDKTAVLKALKEGRDGAIKVRIQAKINGPEYRAAGKVTDAIDDLAESLTGDGEVLWGPTHGIGTGHS